MPKRRLKFNDDSERTQRIDGLDMTPEGTYVNQSTSKWSAYGLSLQEALS